MIRKDINGLKGIAILSIFFYHLFDLLKSAHLSKVSFFDGGFLGVDIFFVISGFLICSGILTKCDENSFSVIKFYQKRLLRIFPPLVVVCLFSLLVGYFILFPDIYLELSKETVSAFIFNGNFRFAASGGYFSLSSQDKILLHTWYLSLTLQFYLLFPLFILSIKKLFGISALRLSILILFVVSLIIALISSKNGQGYLLTQCRLWEILFGSAVFCYQNWIKQFLFKNDKVIIFLRITSGVFLFASLLFTRLDNSLYYISNSVLTVIATALILILNIKSYSIYTLKPAVLLGSISYSLYLWHWPLMVFALRCGWLSSTYQMLCFAIITVAISYLSYRYIEKAVFKSYSVLLAILLCLLIAGFISYKNGENYLSNYMVKEVKSMVNDDLTLEDRYNPSIVMSDGGNHVYHYGLQSSEPKIFIIGDSHSEHYNYYLRNINKIPVYSLFMHATLAYGSRFNSYNVQMVSGPKERHIFYRLYTEMLKKLQSGSAVILANRWDLYYMYYLFEHKLKDNKDNFRGFLIELCNDIDEMVQRYPNLNFFIVGQGIVTSDEVVNCLKTDLKNSFLSKILDPNKCRNSIDFFEEKTKVINNSFIDYSNQRKNVFFIDRNQPLKISDGLYKTFSKNNTPLFFDTAHLSSEGGCVVGKYIIDSVIDKIQY